MNDGYPQRLDTRTFVDFKDSLIPDNVSDIMIGTFLIDRIQINIVGIWIRPQQTVRVGVAVKLRPRRGVSIHLSSGRLAQVLVLVLVM